jgi:hypothetical protein
MPVLADGKPVWLHVEGEKRIVCEDGQFAGWQP